MKGYELDDGSYVYLTEDDFAAAESDSYKLIEIRDFVPYEQIDPIVFERTYYLGPAKGAEKVYSLLVQAMEQSALAAITTYVFHDHERLGCLRVRERLLTLERMYFADEIRPVSGIAPPRQRKVDRSRAAARRRPDRAVDRRLRPRQVSRPAPRTPAEGDPRQAGREGTPRTGTLEAGGAGRSDGRASGQSRCLEEGEEASPGEAPAGGVTIEDLYGLPGTEFVAARDELARSFAKEGRKEDAAALKARRRPTRSAELLNQLAREEPTSVKGLLAAGDRMRRALEAGDRAGVEDSRREVTAAVEKLTMAADGQRPSEQARAEVVTSLQAAAADPAAGERLRDGCLERPLDPPGFEALAGLKLQPSPRPARPAPKQSAVDRAAERERARLERRVEATREALQRAEEAHRAAEAALAEFDG